MTIPLGVWRKADNRSVRSHQKVVDAVNRLSTLSGTGDLFTAAGPHGQGVLDKRQERWLDVREGVITDAGPAGETDPSSSASYWVKLAAVDVAASDAEAAPVASPAGPTSAGGSDEAEPSIVLATNRAERPAGVPAGTHLLPVDETCWVMLVAYRDAGGNKRWLFTHTPVATPIRFGKLKTAWPEFTDHNKVTLTPCVSASDGTTLTDADGDPLPDVVAYVQCPLGSTPPFFAAGVDDVLDYYTDRDGNSVLLHVPMPGTDNLYDVPQITSLVHGKGVGGCGPLRAQ